LKVKFITIIFCWVTITGSAQSGLKNLKRFADSLFTLQKLRLEKINRFQFRQARASNDGKLLVVDVNQNGLPVYRSPLNSNASLTTGAAKLQSGVTGLKLEGENFLIGIWDAGKVQSHVELGNRVISQEGQDFDDHATHVTGTLIAEGINSLAKGMSPKAKVTAFYFDNDEAEMASQAAADETSLLFSNHSYGQVTGWYKLNGEWNWAGDSSVSTEEDYNFGLYGERAQIIDGIAYLAPYYTIVWAAGNDRTEVGNGTHPPDGNSGTGFDCIIPDAVGKNIITVGAVEKVLNYSNQASVLMSNFSSWGPTDDGRIKPDLVGDGVNLFSTIASGLNEYGTNSGTSMATPNVAGSLVLLQELFSKMHGSKMMKAATLKALAIHTAKEAGGFPGPDYRYGWGLLDVEAGAKFLLHEDGVNTVLIEDQLENGEEQEWILTPKQNQKITATVVWTDPAGTPVGAKLDPTNKMLVNDLDIKIVDKDGNEVYPWTLDPGSPTQGAVRGNNERDNVEKIEFDLPLLKTYRLIVSHKGSLRNGKQDFSLLITYQSQNEQAQTFYWIGDTGDWLNPSHWSLTSGGPTINRVPLSNDYVIVDENSFDGVGPDEISFSGDVGIGSLKWVINKSAGLSLNGRKITISKLLNIASSNFKTLSPGEVQLNSAGKGEVNLSNNDLSPVNVTLIKGTWNWSGNASCSDFTIEEGSLSITNSNLILNNLIANSLKDKELKVINSSIRLLNGSNMNGTKLKLISTSSDIKISNTLVILNWNNVHWSGDMLINRGTTTMNGDNNIIQKITVVGKLDLRGSNQIDSLKVAASSVITFNEDTEQKIGELDLIGTPGSTVKLSGGQKASILFTKHKKFCFDYVNVNSLQASGVAVVNAGENGTLSDAPGWYSQKCADILYADFDVKYPCENGLTEFVDKSSGSPQKWKWTLPQSVTKDGVNTDFSFQQKGTFPVSLTVSDNSTSNTYIREVIIKENTLPSNQVIVSNDELFSFHSSSIYAWYRNGLLIPSVTGRSYKYPESEGVYSVVTYDQECDRKSEEFIITHVDNEELIKIYPNPAASEFIIEVNDKSASVELQDLFGRVLASKKSLGEKLVIPVSSFVDGMYVIKLRVAEKTILKRIQILH
jgi:hypothetical protein